MSKRGWMAAWVSLGVLIGCGVQAVDYPDGTGTSKKGIGEACATANDCQSANCVNNKCAAGSGGGQCTGPNDCPSKVCTNGVCQTGTATGGDCKQNVDCATGVCENGKCVGCSSNAQCKDPAKPVCDTASGACGPCTSSQQCPDGLACIQGQCSACTSNDQCPVGQVCVNGKCGPCTSTSQCTAPATCNTTNGQCQGGPGGDSGATLPDTGPGFDACANGQYVGLLGPVGPVWKNLAGSQNADGKQAGDNACAGGFGAGAHVCTWEELKQLDTCGKLVTLKNSTEKAWLHRTAAETPAANKIVDDNPGLGTIGAPGPGATCDNWKYGTNHAFDGEYVEFGGGNMVGHFDAVTTVNGKFVFPGYTDPGGTSGDSSAASGALDCGGVTRKVLCCKS